MKYVRMPIEAESPEQLGYGRIQYNLSESSLRDRRLSDLGIELPDTLLCYGDHLGHPGLRELLAKEAGVAPDEVLITAGAAGALFIIATTLLDEGSHIVVARPNYSTNIETPRAIGCEISYLDLSFDEQYRVDFDRITSLLRPNTKYVSLTSPHNPTGTTMTEEEIRRVLALAESRGIYFLLDETYREMSFDQPAPWVASLSPRAISVSSMSKSYGIPGIRIGWILCRDRDLMEKFLCAKEQMGICGSVVDEEIAYQTLLKKKAWFASINPVIREAFETMRSWMHQEEFMEWVEPSGGVVCFPRIRLDLDVDTEKFYRILLEKYGTYVGPGHWFEMPDHYMRIGYGWPTLKELSEGLGGISRAIRESLIP